MAWRDDVQTALASIGGQAPLRKIYAAVASVREANGQQLPETWQAIIRRELEYNSSDSESHQKRFDIFYSVEGIGSGIWGLRSLEKHTPKPSDISDLVEDPQRQETYRILRDTPMARRIKKLHNNTCQICGLATRISATETYAEAHHIRPLGRPHYGPDKPENIIILCPNHHVLLDYGAIRLDQKQIKIVSGHIISDEQLLYHNSIIIGKSETDLE
ncbi:HNH endonuclease [Methylobacterium sp. HMF5984]|uniref:HNH endonuclease n=1 Tax=Methylobacterium sp. HMF5984 TaxID=3367370 RepID=UPI003851C1F9